jgi:hypothetical protein
MNTRRGCGLAFAAALVLAGCGSSPPVPAGYVFPTRSSSGGGAALLQGVLEVRDGCIYVRPDEGPAYFVIWPDTVSLTVNGDGTPTLLQDGSPFAVPGDIVAVGGGESAVDLRPPDASRCQPPVWSGSEVMIPPPA